MEFAPQSTSCGADIEFKREERPRFPFHARQYKHIYAHWASAAVAKRVLMGSKRAEWWAQLVGALEFTRINIEPIILKKEIEDLRDTGTFESV